MENIPVFIINGFLDAGKTSFIESTITKDNFFQKGRTLYIALEEGEEEISSITLERYNVDKITFSSQEEFSLENLKEAVEDYDPSRIVIEMNFMFDMTKIEFPNYFQIAQIITLIDGVTFPIYFQNMRQKFVDVIKTSDIVCFTKLKSRESLDFFQTSLRLVNSTCMYCLIDEDGNYLMDAFRKVLPYYLDDKIINIKDEDFGTFYIDTFDSRDDYLNKVVSFNGWVVITKGLKDDEFIIGRKVISCCSNDMQFYGFVARNKLGIDLKHDSWANIVAKITVEFNEEYNEDEIVLIVDSIKVIDVIKDPILDLTKGGY